MANSKALNDQELARLRYSPKAIGKIIKAKRLAMGLSQKAACEAIGVSDRTVYEWERGNLNSNAVRLVNWLLSGQGDSVSNMWQQRALVAEAALREVTEVLVEYRGAHQGIRKL